MPSQHKRPPVSFRPPEGDREWLENYAAETGQAVGAVLRAALAEYKSSRITGVFPGQDPVTGPQGCT